VNARQNALASTAGAARFAASDAAISPPTSAPTTPTGPAIAALLTSTTWDGRVAASASNTGATIASSASTCAKSQAAKA